MMEIFTPEILEADHDRRAGLAKGWAFWATFVHDVDLPRGTWTVDGVEQEAALTEASLKAAVIREGAAKPVVAVAAPLHITIARWIGFHPPYAGLPA